MLAILAAAALSATPAAEPAKVLSFHRSPLLASPECKAHGAMQVKDIASPALLYRQDGKAKLSPLGSLPKANHEKAVLRSVNGCAKPVVVQYSVGR